MCLQTSFSDNENQDRSSEHEEEIDPSKTNEMFIVKDNDTSKKFKFTCFNFRSPHLI